MIFEKQKSIEPNGEFFEYIDLDSIDSQKHAIRKSKRTAVNGCTPRARRFLQKGDVLFSTVRPYLRNVAIVTEEYADCIGSTGFFVCHHHPDLLPEYLYFLMLSDYVTMGLNEKMKGEKAPSISNEDVYSWLYPIPPESEQSRIVKKVTELLENITTMSDLNSQLMSLDKGIHSLLNSSILNYAIQGKLVPQDPNDKPIQIQCKNPIIRRDNSYYRTAKGEEICIDEQLPFEIPSNWTWVGLFDICDVQYGYPFDSTKFNDNKKGVPLVRIRDLLPNKTKTFTTEIVSDEYFVNDEDMLVGMDGNFNLVYWSGGQAYLNQRVCKIKCKYESVNKQFIGLYLQYALKNLDNKSYTTVQHLSDKQLRSIIVPIPPYNEQNKIVEEYTKCILLTNQLSY